MHDLIFQNQRQLKRPNLEGYAQQLGLNMSKFKAALDRGTFKGQVNSDMAEGKTVGVRGTPTVFINGIKFRGRHSLDSWKSIIDSELTGASRVLASGTRLNKLYEKLTARGRVYNPNRVFKISTEGSPFLGKKNAKITIVEFSDFQCGYCSRVSPPLKALVKKYPKDIKVVFKNFPLGFHKNARKAAEAGLAANAQGKFWPMHDVMFKNMRALQEANLPGYAKEAGLNVARFKADLASGKFASVVTRDMQEGRAAEVRGTPTLFVNGRKYQGGRSVAAFERVLGASFGLKVKP